MLENIGYPDFIMNNTMLEAKYKGVSWHINFIFKDLFRQFWCPVDGTKNSIF